MKPLLRFIPSGARIVLVILVAIVLPSVLLSIFAIWAIGSERGHVQDRIRRDAHAMTRKVVETTFSTLSSAATKIAGQAAGLDGRDAPELAGELTVELRSLYPYFSQLVLVDKNGAPLYPVVPRSEMMIDLAPERTELRDALGKAQNFEFVQADLDAAARAYRETFEAAANPRLKVSALLGLARISAKQEKWVQAVESYRSALKAYGSEREKNGLLVGPAAALRIAQM